MSFCRRSLYNRSGEWSDGTVPVLATTAAGFTYIAFLMVRTSHKSSIFHFLRGIFSRTAACSHSYVCFPLPGFSPLSRCSRPAAEFALVA